MHAGVLGESLSAGLHVQLEAQFRVIEGALRSAHEIIAKSEFVTKEKEAQDEKSDTRHKGESDNPYHSNSVNFFKAARRGITENTVK